MNRIHARRVSRRAVLRGVAGVAGLSIVAPRVLGLNGKAPPSEKIRLGFIGLGIHGGSYNLPSFLQQDDAQVVALCDVFKDRREKALQTVEAQTKQKGAVKLYEDFRQLLADKNVDAVCISTPDHWHVPITMMALDAGLDVMCEKPTLTIAEGRALVEKVAAKKAVYQVGLEDRSLVHYHKLAEWCRNGAIGTLKTMRVWLPAGNNFAKEAPAPVPPGLNWEMWQGPAPEHPYTPTRTGAEQWRNIKMYAGGKFADWGSHLLDTAQVANFAELSGPVEVEGTGEVPKDAMTTMPVKYSLKYRYANGVEMFVETGEPSLRFEGTSGWVGNKGWRGRLEASSDEILHTKYDPAKSRIWPRPPGEHRDFLDCVKSRKATTYTAEMGQRLSSVMHIGNISIWLGRKLTWDPKSESFVNDEAANKLRSRESRDDWKRL